MKANFIAPVPNTRAAVKGGVKEDFFFSTFAYLSVAKGGKEQNVL